MNKQELIDKAVEVDSQENKKPRIIEIMEQLKESPDDGRYDCSECRIHNKALQDMASAYLYRDEYAESDGTISVDDVLEQVSAVNPFSEKAEQVQDDVEIDGYTLLDWLDGLNDAEMEWLAKTDEAKALSRLLSSRKADEEKRKFVDECVKRFGTAFITSTLFIEMYRHGCRFTENKGQ